MVSVAQPVRASDCGSEGRGFESHHSPKVRFAGLFYSILLLKFALYSSHFSFL